MVPIGLLAKERKDAYLHENDDLSNCGNHMVLENDKDAVTQSIDHKYKNMVKL